MEACSYFRVPNAFSPVASLFNNARHQGMGNFWPRRRKGIHALGFGLFQEHAEWNSRHGLLPLMFGPNMRKDALCVRISQRFIDARDSLCFLSGWRVLDVACGYRRELRSSLRVWLCRGRLARELQRIRRCACRKTGFDHCVLE